MLVAKIRRPLLIGAQISLLSLGVSALPFVSKAQDEDTDRWVWGVAARDAALADADASMVVDYGTLSNKGQGGIGLLAVGSTGLGVTIAIVDTGIDLGHPEFAGRLLPGVTCLGDGGACGGTGQDDHGHGTHVAGIAAAANDGVGNTGVAPDAMLLPVKVLNAYGAGSYQAVAQGISYASENGAQVINMSLGGPRPNVLADYNALVVSLKEAAATSVIVVAAGNSGNGRIPDYPAAFATLPGVVGSLIIAGSLSPNGTVISRFSNTPGNDGCMGTRATRACLKDVFLVAPGEHILSTLPGGAYGYASGTSMAAPYIAGAAAVVLSAAPYLTPHEVASILFTSAIDLGRPGTDPIYGRGLVNPAGAIAPLGSLSVATSGATAWVHTGTGNLRVSSLGGALAFGLRSSHAAHDLTFFDAFNRDYRVDLTKSIASNAASLAHAIAQDGPALRSMTYLGDDFSASALVADGSTNMVAFAGQNAREAELRDAVITARLSDDASVALGYKASAAGRLNQLDLAASEAFDGLFMSATAMNSPYLGFAPDASLIAASVGVDDDVSLSLGYVSQAEQHDTVYADEVLTADERRDLLFSDQTHLASGEGSAASVGWRFASWGMAGLNVTHTDEQNALFGAQEGGALALTGDAATTSAGVGLRVNLGRDWVATASWNAGISEVTPLAGGLFSNISELRTQAYGAALAKRGVFGMNDSIGFGISRPLHVVEGTALFRASTGVVTKAREIIYSTETIDLASATPETDVEVGYTALIGKDVFLQANAVYQLDLDGVSGNDAIAGLATLKTIW